MQATLPVLVLRKKLILPLAGNDKEDCGGEWAIVRRRRESRKKVIKLLFKNLVLGLTQEKVSNFLDLPLVVQVPGLKVVPLFLLFPRSPAPARLLWLVLLAHMRLQGLVRSFLMRNVVRIRNFSIEFLAWNGCCA